MLFPTIRKAMRVLISTPFHPQWHNYRVERSVKDHFLGVQGNLLDVGAGNGQLQKIIPDTVNYFGLDYPVTISKGYSGTISVYGDGMALPFKANSFDTVVMLDVLEHIPDAKKALNESIRVLKIGGNLIIKVPFIYPIHDRPHDFQRWTEYGLEYLSQSSGAKVKYCSYFGEPGESAALIANIGLCAGMLQAVRKGRLGMIFAPIIVLLVPLINLLGYILPKVFPKSDLMPLGYIFVLEK